MFLPFDKGEKPVVWNCEDEEEEQFGAEDGTVETTLTSCLNHSPFPLNDPSILMDLGAGGFLGFVTPSSICKTFPIVGLWDGCSWMHQKLA